MSSNPFASGSRDINPSAALSYPRSVSPALSLPCDSLSDRPSSTRPSPLRGSPFRGVTGPLNSRIVPSLTLQHVLLFRRPKDYDLHHKPFAVSNASSRMVNVAPQK